MPVGRKIPAAGNAALSVGYQTVINISDGLKAILTRSATEAKSMAGSMPACRGDRAKLSCVRLTTRKQPRSHFLFE